VSVYFFVFFSVFLGDRFWGVLREGGSILGVGGSIWGDLEGFFGGGRKRGVF
jgi:hypothetical protein